MKPIFSLVTLERLEELASRSHFRYGKNVARDGTIAVNQPNAFNLTAKVEYGSKQVRTVEFMSTPKGFRWKCSCSSRKDFFCEHCVAVGLYIIEEQAT